MILSIRVLFSDGEDRWSSSRTSPGPVALAVVLEPATVPSVTLVLSYLKTVRVWPVMRAPHLKGSVKQQHTFEGTRNRFRSQSHVEGSPLSPLELQDLPSDARKYPSVQEHRTLPWTTLQKCSQPPFLFSQSSGITATTGDVSRTAQHLQRCRTGPPQLRRPRRIWRSPFIHTDFTVEALVALRAVAGVAADPVFAAPGVSARHGLARVAICRTNRDNMLAPLVLLYFAARQTGEMPYRRIWPRTHPEKDKR